jgi:hypothetical protein
LQAWAALPPVIALMGFVALASCQSVDRSGAATAAREAAPEPAADQVEPTATAASTSAYPSLHTVPPRPRLSYNVEQRRAIVDGLIADRENARYTDQVIRYRSGQSSLPPPPAPPAALAAMAPEGLVEPPPRTEPEPDQPVDPDASYDGDQAFGQQYDEDTLSTFVDELARDTAEEPLGVPGPAGAADTTGSEPEAGGDGPRWLDWLDGLLGRTEGEPAEPAGASAAAPAAGPDATAPPLHAVDDDASVASIQAAWRKEATPTSRHGPAGDQSEVPRPVAQPLPAEVAPARPDPDATGIAIGVTGVAIGEGAVALAADEPLPGDAPSSILVRFEPGSASLPPDAGSQLGRVLATAKAQGAVIRIEGAAEAPALALDRARAVALGLMRLGARARDLEMGLAPAMTGDRARVLLAGPVAR